jgi:hypothetical protein
VWVLNENRESGARSSRNGLWFGPRLLLVWTVVWSAVNYSSASLGMGWNMNVGKGGSFIRIRSETASAWSEQKKNTALTFSFPLNLLLQL